MRHMSIRDFAGHHRRLGVRRGGFYGRLLYDEHIQQIFAVFLWFAAIATFIILSR